MIQVDGIFVQGGGFSASISVVTGASLPNTVTNGQIFVVTSTTPTNIYVDTNAPASPTSGDMWIEIASSDIGIVFSTIPFFRNGFLNAKQYNGEVWINLAGYLGHEGAWLQFSYVLPDIGISLEECTWQEINVIGAAGVAGQYFSVGDTKSIPLASPIFGSTSFSIEILDFFHDNLVTGGKSPYSFGMVDCFNTIQAINSSATNVGGWEQSELRAELNSTIFNSLPIDLSMVIKPVNKKTSEGGQSTQIVTTIDKLFLFSEVEAFGTANFSVVGEGTQYSFFSTAQSRIKNVNGTPNRYHLRSPFKGDTQCFCYIDNIGSGGYAPANTQYGVAFGFCV